MSLGLGDNLIKRMSLFSESANTSALVSGVRLPTGWITVHYTYTFKPLASVVLIYLICDGIPYKIANLQE